jgi:signal transduction histidine kinase
MISLSVNQESVMLLTVLSYIPAVLCLYAIGALTFLKDTRSQINRYFGIFTVCLASWISFLFIGDFVLRPFISLWSVRVAALLGTSTLPFFLFFCLIFPRPSPRLGKKFGLIASIPAVVFGILCLTPWLIPAIDLRANSAQPAKIGLLYTLQSVYLILGYIFCMGLLAVKRRHVNARQKDQITLVISGVGAALAVNVLTGFVLTVLKTSNNYSNLVGSISFLIFVGTTAYAIVKHRMFDIRLAIVRAVGFIFTVVIVAGIYSLIVLGVGALFISPGASDRIRNLSQLLILIPPTIFVGLTFHWIQSLIARLTRQIFYQGTYDLKTVLDKISDTLITDNDIDKIMSRSLSVISEAIKPSHAYLAVFDDKKKLYRELSIKSKPADETIFGLIKYVRTMSSNPLVRDELTEDKLPDYLMNDDLALVLRLGTKDDLIAILVFGNKQDGRTYTADDISLLHISAKNLGIALDNAKKYDQIGHFAETMRQEVLNATSKLRKANEELKTLDVMKDDFISMASHQLRTPATSVHEALQMLNHPSMPLTHEDRSRLIELAEASSEHLATVVADMLSISRIQAGHFNINKSLVKMVELVERVLMQTAVLAEQKHIKLSFHKPSAEINVEADQAKINEAISNYIENAIKYSREKTMVTLSLTLKNRRVIFEATDQGMGVPEKERKNLFGKFFRAGNARVEQPDGNGIGLFVVKSIAAGHGGDAYYKPLDNGSLFGFWLPIADS